jgi:hypothetical protein
MERYRQVYPDTFCCLTRQYADMVIIPCKKRGTA